MFNTMFNNYFNYSAPNYKEIEMINYAEKDSTIEFKNKFDPNTIEIRKKMISRKVFNDWRQRVHKRINADSTLDHLPNIQAKFREMAIRRENERWEKKTLDQSPTIGDVFKHAEKLKTIYQRNGYRVFTHGVSIAVSTIFDINKIIIEHFHPEFYREHHFVPFRIPGKVPDSVDVESFAKKYSIDKKSFVDNKFPLELMSVDADFNNTQTGESAKYFFFVNDNMTAAYKRRPIISKLISDYIKQEDLSKLFTDRFMQIAEHRRENSENGVLYVIAAPREEVKHFAYRSHKVGRRCNHFYLFNDEAILDRIQEGKLKGEQYRFVTSCFAKVKEVETIGLTTVPQKNQTYYLKLMDQLGLEMAVCHMIDEVNANPDPEKVRLLAKKSLELLMMYHSPTPLEFAQKWKPLFLPNLSSILDQHHAHLNESDYNRLIKGF